MKKITVLLLALSLVLLSFQFVGAQQNDEIKMLKQEVENLKKGQESIKKDIKELKALLKRTTVAKAAPAQPKESVVSIDDDPFLGKANAKLTMIEFSDYQ